MIDELRDGRAGTAVLPGDDGWGANPPIYPPGTRRRDGVGVP